MGLAKVQPMMVPWGPGSQEGYQAEPGQTDPYCFTALDCLNANAFQ